MTTDMTNTAPTDADHRTAGAGPVQRSVRAPAPERTDGGPLLRVVPCDLKTANEFVRLRHRHSRPVVGHKFAVGVEGGALPRADCQP